MSGAQTSTFADPNLLLSTLSGAQTARVMQNQLLNQETAALMPYHVQEAQQQVGAQDTEMAARIAGTLMDPTLYPTTEARAAAYPGLISEAQSRGYLKNAPSVYPGDERAAALARMGIPSTDIYQWQMGRSANQALVPTAPGTAAAPGGGGTSTATTLPIPGRGIGGPGASAQLPPEYLPYVMEASQKYGLPPDLIIAQMRQESGFDANAKGKAGEIGLMQIMPSTAQNPGMGLQGVDPATLTGPQNARNNIMFGAAYLRAHMGNGDPNNPAVQASALHAYNGGGDPNYVANVFRYRPGLAPGDPRTQITTYQVGAPGTQVATAPGTAPPAAPGGGVAARYPGAVQAAGPAAGAPAATPGAPAAVPATPDLMGPRPMPPVGPGSPTPPTPQALANTPFPQPGANALAPGGPGNPPAAQPPAAPAAAPSGPQPPPAPTFQPPPVVPRPPPPPTIVADGLTAGQISDLNAMAARPGFPTATLAQRKYEYQQQNIQQANTYQAALEKERADAIQTQATQAQVGNLALETWKAAHPDAKVTTVGGEIITQDPRTGAEIAPRIPVTPDRPEAMAMVTLGRLASKIQSGQPLTPQEASDYNVAYQMIGKPTLVEDPISKQKSFTYQTDMSGFPPPPGTTPGPRPITQGLSPKQQAIERDPSGYKVATTDYEHDAKEMPAITDTVRAAQQDQIRIAEMQGILQELATGPGRAGIEHAKAWLQANLPSAVNPFSDQTQNLSGPAAAEVFQKLAFKGSVAQERQSSSRGGYAVTKLFQQLNPGMDLLNPANTSLLNTQLVSNQADIDYGTAANQFYLNQKDRFRDTNQYDSQQYFEQQWINQRNPQVYNAAIMALNGNTKWWDDPKNGRLSDEEYARALQIMQRAKPSATVQTKNGPYQLQPNAVTTGAQSTPGNTIIRYDHNGNRVQ